MGSPSLLVWQPPPNPDQIVFPAVGPAIRAPLDLLKIAKEVFTHCTYWVAPTVPLVSGGAPVTLKPYWPLPRPSKLCRTGGVGGGTVAVCSTGSSCNCSKPGGRGMRFRGSTGRRVRDGGGACRIISLRGRETSWWTLRLTVVGPDWANRGRANNSNRLAASAERWAVALLCLYIDSLLGFGEDQLHFSFFPGAHFPQGGALLRNVALGDVITRQNISHS